jgi:hypothetical protein
VTRVLERLIGERGRPENVRSDNGPEFTLACPVICTSEIVSITRKVS